MAKDLVAQMFSEARSSGIVTCSSWLPPADALRIERAVRAAVREIPGTYQVALHPGRRPGTVEISVSKRERVRAAEVDVSAFDRPDAIRATLAELSTDRRASHRRRPA